MKTLQEKYNAILEGNFSKKQFVRDARLGHPNLITQFNGFDDTVTILKNRGMIQEAKKQEVPQYDKPQPGYSLEALERAVDYELEGMGIDTATQTPTEEQNKKATEKAEKNLQKDPNHYLNLLSGESKKVDKHDKYIEVKKDNHVDTFNGMKKADLREGIVEKAMSKGYSKEQVEEALARLKEKKGKDLDGDGDIDGDDYMAAKDQAIKKAMGKKVDEIGMFHAAGYSATAAAKDKRALRLVKDLINKGVDKEDAIKKAAEKFKLRVPYLIRYVDRHMVKEVNEGRRRKMKGGKVVTENDYETGGYVEAMGPRLEKALKHLIQMWDEWKQGPMTEPGMVPHAKNDLVNYITNQLKEQEEEVLDEQFFDDLEAAKAYARKESEQGFVQHVNKHPKGGFRVEDWLDGSNTVASYEGGDVLEEDLMESINKIEENLFDTIAQSALAIFSIMYAFQLGGYNFLEKGTFKRLFTDIKNGITNFKKDKELWRIIEKLKNDAEVIEAAKYKIIGPRGGNRPQYENDKYFREILKNKLTSEEYNYLSSFSQSNKKTPNINKGDFTKQSVFTTKTGIDETHINELNDKYLKSIKRIIQFPDVQEDPDPHFSMGRGELVWNYLTQKFPELNRIGEEEWMQINSLVYQELKKQGLKEDHTGNPNDKYVVKKGKGFADYEVWEGNVKVKEFSGKDAKEKAREFALKKRREQGLEENIYGTPAFIKGDNRTSEHPKWNELSADEIQAYIDDPEYSLWGWSLSTAKMVRDRKRKEERGLNESQLKQVFKGIITNILNEEIITEAATGNLSKIASQYDDFEGMQSAVNSLENIVTDIESYYSKTREKIQKVYDSFNNIKNPDGLNMGALLGPSIQAAFMKDLVPVRDKGFTKGLSLPKVRILKPGDIQEKEIEEKKTVYTPVNENRKTKYTKK